ncbi:MAG TPA: hypothetical protein VIU64_17530 [Polyangia bacterium]
MSKASTIRPGLLVSVKSNVAGGVSYQRIDLDTDQPAEEGKDIARWETRRIIEDKAEHERATKVRSAARALITKCCSTTSFGLLCPSDQEGALDAAIREARRIVDEFNESASHTRVTIYALKGRVASDDAEAARAITSEIAGLVQAMDAGIKAFDPKAIRDAANRARELSGMLSEEKSKKVEAAIEQARKAARTIVKRIETEGEARETVLLDIQRGQIESARIAFLDLSGDAGQVEQPTPTTNLQRFADLDVGDEPGERPTVAAGRADLPALDLE